jgi:hypothetical protein
MSYKINYCKIYSRDLFDFPCGTVTKVFNDKYTVTYEYNGLCVIYVIYDRCREGL